MKNNLSRILATLLLAFSIIQSFAGIVGKSDAEKAARNYFFERLNQREAVPFDDVAISGTYTITAEGQPAYYAVNFSTGGFVLITADDNLRPIIGYSYEGNYAENDHPETFAYWMDYIKSQVVYYRQTGAQADEEIRAAWKKLSDDAFSSNPVVMDAKDVNPLVMSKWDQAKFYNTMCPADPLGPEDHALTGCVATAMSQLMYYYRYPSEPQGAHGYWCTNPSGNPNYGNYGFLQVVFAGNTYHYEEMVNQPNEANLELAKLMYHCGVSVNMNFGPLASGAMTEDVPGALINYFKYNNSCTFSQRSAYVLADWENLLKANIDLKHPLLYSGRNSSYGHCFICDGYQVQGTTNMFHFNWGWGGSYDGYFSVNNLNPGGDPPFSQGQGIVRNAYPGSGYPSFCSGQTVISGTKGTIEDGSGYTMNYQDNANCSWLIAPNDSVKKLTLIFERFDTEANNDVVTVYDGDNTSAPVLFTHSGPTVPTQYVNSTGNRMLVTFTSNGSVNAEGFLATIKPTYPQYCTGSTLTASSGTVSDGSGAKTYNNNTTCSWIIQPPGATAVTLTFTAMDTEQDKDLVKVYDLTTQTLLGTYSGAALPPAVTAPSGAMYIEFKTNYVYTYDGWTANYTVPNIGFDELRGIRYLSIYPIPASNELTVDLEMEQPGSLNVELINVTGQKVFSELLQSYLGRYQKNISLERCAKGIYFLKLTSDQGSYSQKVVVE